MLSKAHFILTTASGCIGATMKSRLGILLHVLQVRDISSEQIFVTTKMTKALLTQIYKLNKIIFIYFMKCQATMS